MRMCFRFFLLLAVLGIGCNKPTPELVSSRNLSDEDAKMIAQVYPHSDEFKTQHGKTHATQGHLCTTCHGINLKGGTSKVSCTQCHTSYPHPKGWAMPDQHGKTYTGLDVTAKNQCLECHQKRPAPKNIPDEFPVTDCATCHLAYPHPPIPDGEDMPPIAMLHIGLDNESLTTCLPCHRGFMENFSQPAWKAKGCFSCHRNTDNNEKYDEFIIEFKRIYKETSKVSSEAETKRKPAQQKPSPRKNAKPVN